jgi:hypothetical protein
MMVFLQRGLLEFPEYKELMLLNLLLMRIFVRFASTRREVFGFISILTPLPEAAGRMQSTKRLLMNVSWRF